MLCSNRLCKHNTNTQSQIFLALYVNRGYVLQKNIFLYFTFITIYCILSHLVALKYRGTLSITDYCFTVIRKGV